MSKTNRMRILADALAAGFEAAGFTPAELLQGQVIITDLGWQAPPLRTKATLQGVPLHEYLDYPLQVDSQKLVEFYKAALFSLRHGPEEISNEEGYKGLSLLMPRALPGERCLALPLPDGWPAGDSTTGPLFAMEVARLLNTSSMDVAAFVEDESNYYVDTRWGRVGLVDGYVSVCREEWDISCEGQVPAFLEKPRGQLSTVCMYDLIARLRSCLHEHADRFAEFEGMDFALQALRILSKDRMCLELLRAVEGMSKAAFRRKARKQAFEEALAVMESWNYTDRTKLSMIQEILLPQYYNLAQFCRKIYDVNRYVPAVFSKPVEARIINMLKHEIRKLEVADTPRKLRRGHS